jgi:hypothetical protein
MSEHGHEHEHPDASQGWCCDGRTWAEHASEGGECCQPKGTQLPDLPADAQEKARERLSKVSG